MSGINEKDWFSPTSTVGRELIEAKPVLILTFDPAPTDRPILGDRYRLAEVKRFPTALEMRGFARIGGPCDRGSGT